MVIRPAQINAFERIAQQRFEQSAWNHLQEFVPRHCTAVGENTARVAIRAAMERASRYALMQERPVRQFIDLSFIFGAAFDEDPQYPWIGPMLEGPAETAMARMDNVYEKALQYVVRISGPQGELADAALKRVAQKPMGKAISAGVPFPQAVYFWLDQVFPEKTSFLGQRRAEELISGWERDAAACGLSAPIAMLVYITLGFFLGSGFRFDPLVPWAHAIAGPAAPDGGEARARGVYEVGMKTLEGWFSDVHSGM